MIRPIPTLILCDLPDVRDRSEYLSIIIIRSGRESYNAGAHRNILQMGHIVKSDVVISPTFYIIYQLLYPRSNFGDKIRYLVGVGGYHRIQGLFKNRMSLKG